MMIAHGLFRRRRLYGRGDVLAEFVPSFQWARRGPYGYLTGKAHAARNRTRRRVSAAFLAIGGGR